VRDYSLTVMLPGASIASVGESLAQLAERGREEFREYVGGEAECLVQPSVDLRYRGQGMN